MPSEPDFADKLFAPVISAFDELGDGMERFFADIDTKYPDLNWYVWRAMMWPVLGVIGAVLASAVVVKLGGRSGSELEQVRRDKRGW